MKIVVKQSKALLPAQVHVTQSTSVGRVFSLFKDRLRTVLGVRHFILSVSFWNLCVMELEACCRLPAVDFDVLNVPISN